MAELAAIPADDELGESSTTTLTPTELAVYGFVGLSSLVLLLYVGAEVAFGGYIFTYSIRALNMSHPEGVNAFLLHAPNRNNTLTVAFP